MRMQGRKPEIEIKEDVEYLKKLYQNEKHSKKRERLYQFLKIIQ